MQTPHHSIQVDLSFGGFWYSGEVLEPIPMTSRDCIISLTKSTHCVTLLEAPIRRCSRLPSATSFSFSLQDSKAPNGSDLRGN